MKATGVVRRIDDLGRVVIPKEIARELGIEIGDYFDLKVENGIIIITPEKAITKDIKPTKEVKTKNSKPLIINKDLIIKKGYLMINPKKRYVMNQILLKML